MIEMWLIIGLLTLLVWLLYKYYVSVYNTYWQKRGIPSIPSKFPFGSDPNFITMRKFQGRVLDEMYYKMSQTPYFGVFSMREPLLIVKDPELIHLVLVKEFSHFRDRLIFKFDEKDYLTQHLFNLDGERWRALRVKLTPTFTSGKLKTMFPIFISCSEAYEKLLQTKINSEIDIKDLTGRLTMDIICSSAFGLDTNTINEPDQKLRKIGLDALQIKFMVILKVALVRIMPKLAQFFGSRFTPIETEEYLINLVKETIEYREKNNIIRNDFLDLLIKLKNKGTVGDDMKDEIEEHTCQPFELTIELLTAQCFVFFVAGFETSSTVQTFCLYELAINQDIQTKLKKEIDYTIQKHGSLTYQAVQEMEYLDMVMSETMRKYPTLLSLLRRCTKTLNTPEGYKFEKDDTVIIPVWSLHHDPDYFPNPEKFDPERFSAENKELIKPFTYLPFGEGPRICIGMRFAQVQTKIGLITVLKNFRVEPCKATKIPLELGNNPTLTNTKDPIVLKLVAHSSN